MTLKVERRMAPGKVTNPLMILVAGRSVYLRARKCHTPEFTSTRSFPLQHNKLGS